MFNFNDVIQEYKYEYELRRKCAFALRGIEKEKISCYEKDGRNYYRSYKGGRYHHVGSESSRAVVMQKKRFLMEQMIKRLDHNLELMKNLTKNFEEVNPFIIQKGFPKGFQNIPSEFIKDLGFVDPESCVASSNSSHPDSLQHTTISGIMVRSRIEAIIADIYTAKGIAFSYEKQLILPDGTVLYPDFTIQSERKGKQVFHEHIGMISDEDYLKSFIWKFQKYCEFDLYPFDSVLYTFEKADGSIDSSEIAYLIDLFR